MTTQSLNPFGLEVLRTPGSALAEVPLAALQEWIAMHRIVVLRGLAAPAQEEMLAYCRQLGEILEWEFGAVNDLQVRADSRNYLYTNRAVPFHWDGAFAGRVPHYIFFHCQAAPPAGTGGETTFCDTIRLFQNATRELRDQWQRIQITYSTEKIVHYGGSFTAAMIARHPLSGETVVRFAEPVDDLNPVRLMITGIPADQHAAFLARMHELLNDPSVCYAHEWRTGDVVFADNHALLHGRRPYRDAAPRHLRRVNIL